MKVPGAENSVLVKARAMYSDRLEQLDFAAMLAMTSTAEVADYLKNRTCYSAELQGFSATAPYRGQLIGLLRSKHYEEFASLCRYESSIGQSLYKYFILHNDCMQILQRLRTLGESIDEAYISSLPSHYVALSQIDLYSLVNAATVRDVINCLDGTEYKELISKNEALLISRDNIILVEAEMNAYCGRRLTELIKKDCSVKARGEMIELVSFCKDAEMLVRLYRLKKLMNAPEEMLRRFDVPQLTLLSKKERDAIFTSPDCEAMVKAVCRTQYAPIFSGVGDPEALSQRLVVQRVKKHFGFAKSAAEALWCFMLMREAEVNDITNIFEGVRCKVPPESIKQYIYCVSL